MRTRLCGWVMAGVAVVAVGCEKPGPASLYASASVSPLVSSCTSQDPPGTACTLTGLVNVLVQERSGRDVQLESLSSALRDSEGHDMQATPAAVSPDEVRISAGSSVVGAHGQLSITYSLAFTSPYLRSPFTLLVHVRGLDTAGNTVETECSAVASVVPK